MPGGVAERALAAVSRERRQELENVSGLRWLPFEVHMAVLGAMRRVLGAEGYRRYCFEQISASLSMPELFEKPAKLALRLYEGPFALFRALPPSMPYVFRNAGSVRVALLPGVEAVEATYDHLPSRFAGGDTWHLIWLATFDALATHAAVRCALGVNTALIAHEPSRGHFKWRIEVVT